MRTPQRNFVVEFKSGRRQPKAGANSIWGDTDLKAFVRDVEESASHPFNSSQALRAPDADGGMLSDPINAGSVSEYTGNPDVLQTATPSADGVEVDVSTQRQADHPPVEVVAQVPESEPAARPQATLTGAARKRVKRTATREIHHSSTATRGEQSVQSETAGDPVPFDEVAALNAENKRLKRLLAEQLHAQNLQLKKMLERFDLT